MKSGLILAAVAACAYIVFFLNALIVFLYGEPADVASYWLGETGMNVLVYSVFLVVPAHLLLIYMAVKKEVIIWSTGVPFFLAPYMIGSVIQALVL